MTTTWNGRGFLFSFLGASTLVGAGCSSTQDDVKYPTADSFCAAKAEAECSSVEAICGVTRAACAGARRSTCMEFAAASVSPSRAYKPANAEACLDAVAAAYKDQRLSLAEEDPNVAGSMGERCARVFEGKGTKGDGCTSTFDCTGGLICGRARVPGAASVCATKTDRAEKDGCANGGDTCPVGMFCDATRGVTCAPARKLDEACSIEDPTAATYAPCAATGRCDAASAKCVPRVENRGECQSHADCAASAPYCATFSGAKRCTTEVIFSQEASICREFGVSG